VLASLTSAFILAAALQQAPADSNPAAIGPGISEALARARAGTIADVTYDLVLDLTTGDSAAGRVVIGFRRSGASDVVLDFRGRRLGRVMLNGVELDRPLLRHGHLLLPRARLRAGSNTVALDFVADIAPSGASIIRSDDPSDGSTYLYTLLVPADANQLFPCFDQPDLKARVRLTLTARAAWSVVANGPAVDADTAAGGVTTRFAETPPISTYLIAFAAGPWAHVQARVAGRSITAYMRRSRAREADLDTLIALNGRALEWMERYFGRAYPFAKFDFVLAPAFPFGGMEHPGAVFYSEDAFIFRERPTLPRRLARYSTILHEAAHQWFGDLVTMRWFDDLWLKEGFATFMAAKALAELEPDADAWKTFYLGNKPSAYGVDRTEGTRPLYQTLGNLDQAKSNYGAIVYNKAPAVLKQLEYLVGNDAFQRGVQAFLRRHAFGNATWRDLLGSVGTAAGRSLEGFGRDFMLRPGMPVVEQRLLIRNGRIARLVLAQRPARALSGRRPWIERTEVLLAYSGRPPVRIPVELRDTLTQVSRARGLPAPDFVFANAGDYGYFLLLLDSASVAALEHGALHGVKDNLLRAMLWGALWDQVRAYRMGPDRYVRLTLQELPWERDEQIVPVLIGRLGRAVEAYLRPEERPALQLEVERVLRAGADDRTLPYGVRKAYIDGFIGLAASQAGAEALDSLLDADSAAGEPLRDPTRWNAVTRLLELAAPSADQRLAQQERKDTTADGRRRAFIAGAGRPSVETKREYFTRWFSDSTLNEEWATGSLGPFNALEHKALTFPWLRPALDSLAYIQAHRRIFFLESWLAAFLQGQTGDSALALVREWLHDHPRLGIDLRRKVLQHMDELERTVRIRGRRDAGAHGRRGARTQGRRRAGAQRSCTGIRGTSACVSAPLRLCAPAPPHLSRTAAPAPPGPPR
jgi:aminopeptidase N